MDKPGGGRFFDAVTGCLLPFAVVGVSPILGVSEGSPLAERRRRDSMMERCCSLTDILRCSCSRMVGS
jgi:hypothetical protein